MTDTDELVKWARSVESGREGHLAPKQLITELADRIEALTAQFTALRDEAKEVVEFYKSRNRDGTGRGNYAGGIEGVEPGEGTAVPGIPWGTRAAAFLDKLEDMK